MSGTIQDATVEPWASIKHLLDGCDLAVRCRYKGGDEDLLGSLCTTFIKLREEAAKRPEDRAALRSGQPGYVRDDGFAHMSENTFDVWARYVAKPGEIARWRKVRWADDAPDSTDENRQLREALEAWEGAHCGGDCFASPCSACDGTRRTSGKGEQLQVKIDELTAEMREAKAQLEQLEVAAVRDVLAERRRQVEVEGWTPEHDDEHNAGVMATASACYSLAAAAQSPDTNSSWRMRFANAANELWPWDREWWKPGAVRRMLVKASALLLAEIERGDRAAGGADAQPSKQE